MKGRPTIPVTRILTALLVLTFALRLAVALRAGERPLIGDELNYDEIAWNLATGHGYQVGATDAERHLTAQRGPAYILYLAGCFRLFGNRLVPVVAGQCLMEVASALLVFRLGRRWFRSGAVGLVAVGGYALYPPFIMLSTSMLTETFTSLTFLGTIAAFDLFLERWRTRDLASAGVALGLCALNKPQLGPIAVLLPLATRARLGWARAVRAASVITLTAALVMAPWIIRNAIVFRQFVPGVSTSGLAFWGGAAPVGGRFVGGLDDAWVPDTLRRALNRMDELARSRWMMSDARRVIAADPVRYARLTGRKFLQLWFNLGFDDPPSRASLLLAMFNLGAFLLAFVGARRHRPDAHVIAMVVALGVYWTAAHVPFCTVVRYAVPYLPVLFTFSAAGLVPKPAQEA